MPVDTTETTTPEDVAERFVDDLLPIPSWGDVMATPSEAYDALIATLKDTLPAHQREDVLSLGDHCRLYEQVRDALPNEALQDVLSKLNEDQDIDTAVREEAAFLIGLAMGRRRQRPGGAR